MTANGGGPDDGGSGSRLRIGRDPEAGVGGEPEIDVSLAAIESLGSLTWAVPSLVLAVPGLLLVLAVLAQAVGGVLWLPVIRRRIGSFGVGGRRRG
jgi:hypothetical protein